MSRISEVAKYIRSKNAGPFWLTIDIFCNDKEGFIFLKNSVKLSPENIAKLYDVDPKKMKVFYMERINVIKYSFPRPKPQGNIYENDMHGGQQYILLSELEV